MSDPELQSDQGGAGDDIEAGDAAGPTAETDSELIRELSLADGPVLPPGHEPSAHNNEHTDEHDVPQHVGVADSSVWEPSTIHEDQGHPEPNFLPAFASEENKKINRDVQRLEENLEQAEADFEETKDRKQIMDEHLKSVQSEIAYSQARVTAKRKEIQSEAHLKALGERELARYDADIRVLKKERSELLDKVNGLQNHIYRANEKMDQFKILMNWSQEELEQWTLTQQQKEEDSEAIERYHAQDRNKIKELDLAVERMNHTVATRRTELEREVTDTQSAQMQLQKAADDFARLHKERQELIQQWENALAQMRRTDDAINVASELFAEKRSALREKQRRLDISAQFLDDQLQTNRDCEGLIAALERDLAALRSQYATEQAQFAEVSEQVEIMKTTLSKSGNDHASSGQKNASLQAELGSKRARLDEIRSRVAANHRKLESEYSHLGGLGEKEKELTALSALEDKRLVEVEKSLRALEKLQFEKGQELFKERKREKDLISEISGGQAQSRNLVNKIQQLDEQVIRQQELLYNVEFQLQQMERRVSRAKGERSDEETTVLNERIKALTTELEGVNAQHSMLLGQVKKAEDELQHANTSHAQQTQDLGKVQGDMEAVELETEMLTRSVKKTTTDRQAKLVDLDVQRLEVQQLREALNAQADTVFTLENKKYQLEQSLKERRHEISVHRQALEAEHKLAKDDVHRITMELQERRARVDKLEAKFNVVSTKKHSLYEEEEPKSQAYYVIKAAQERQELQQRGDMLDADNHRLQDEVNTLEQTLEQMVASNTAYNRSYKPVNEKRAFAERAKLREQLDKVYDRLKFKRQEERGMAGDVAQAEARVRQLQEEEADLRRIVDEVERHRVEAQAAVQDEEEHLEQSHGRYEHATESIPADAAQLTCTRVHLMRSANEAMLNELSDLVAQHPDAGIESEMQKAGLSIARSGAVSAEGTGSRPGTAASLALGVGGI